jgi:GNAT superfamily N-acetyltransferase
MLDIVPSAVAPPAPSIVAIEEGVAIRVRPLGPADEGTLKYGLEHLSPQSSYHRFLSVRKGASEAELHYLVHPDQVNHLALGAELIGAEGGPTSGVGVARSIFLPGSSDTAEYAIAVADDFQGLGIGTLLLRELAAWAYRTGVRRWLAVQLATNVHIIKTTGRVATEISRTPMSDGVLEVLWQLHPPVPEEASAGPSTRDSAR